MVREIGRERDMDREREREIWIERESERYGQTDRKRLRKRYT